jgi:hypothetical protein
MRSGAACGSGAVANVCLKPYGYVQTACEGNTGQYDVLNHVAARNALQHWHYSTRFDQPPMHEVD